MTVPGWYADPTGVPQLRFWDGTAWTPQIAPYPHLHQPQHHDPGLKPLLDIGSAQLRAEDPAAWGAKPVLLPIGAFVAVIVAVPVVAAFVNPSSDNGKLAFAIVVNLGVSVVLSLAVWVAGRDIAARQGGWGRAFGWRRPRPIDLAYAAAGFGATFIARIVIAVFANALTHGRASKEAQNLQLDHVSIASVIFLIVVVAIFAPLIEELVFRGLLLRTFMRRLRFWPAALLSSLIFALFHTYEVDTVAGAITLALTVGSLGLINCILNRYTDRLAAGIVVHVSFNLLAVIVLIALAQ